MLDLQRILSAKKRELRDQSRDLQLLQIADCNAAPYGVQAVVNSYHRAKKVYAGFLAALPLAEQLHSCVLSFLLRDEDAFCSTACHKKALWLCVRRDWLCASDYAAIAFSLCRSGDHNHCSEHRHVVSCEYLHSGGVCPVLLNDAEHKGFHHDSTGCRAVALSLFNFKSAQHSAIATDALKLICKRPAHDFVHTLVGSMMVEYKSKPRDANDLVKAVWLVGKVLTTIPSRFTLHKIRPAAYKHVFGERYEGMSCGEMAAAWTTNFDKTHFTKRRTLCETASKRASCEWSCAMELHAQLSSESYDAKSGRIRRSLKLWLPSTCQEFTLAERVPIHKGTWKTKFATSHKQTLRFVFGTPPVCKPFCIT